MRNRRLWGLTAPVKRSYEEVLSSLGQTAFIRHILRSVSVLLYNSSQMRNIRAEIAPYFIPRGLPSLRGVFIGMGFSGTRGPGNGTRVLHRAPSWCSNESVSPRVNWGLSNPYAVSYRQISRWLVAAMHTSSHRVSVPLPVSPLLINIEHVR